MDRLLHWDFNPGLKVEDQVRRRFRSTVHFSPSPTAKEFFLVVTFSSTSFPLSRASVGLALCIEGLASGFKVAHIGANNFWFSMASNKMGHFIYALQDRVWPDFVCHFSLFRSATQLPMENPQTWHLDQTNQEVLIRSPLAVKSKYISMCHNNNVDVASLDILSQAGFSPAHHRTCVQLPAADHHV